MNGTCEGAPEPWNVPGDTSFFLNCEAQKAWRYTALARIRRAFSETFERIDGISPPVFPETQSLIL